MARQPPSAGSVDGAVARRGRLGPLPPPSPTRLLCIVPALNEEHTVAAVIADIRAGAVDADIIVVDDGSRDDTSGAAAACGVSVLRSPFNMGIGGAVQAGMICADEGGYQFAVQVDGDGQHVADEIRTLIDAQRETGANVVIGSRFLSGTTFRSSAARRGGMRFLSALVSALARQRFTDTTSGFRLYDRRSIELLSIDYPEDYPEVEAILFLRRAGLSVVETQVEMRERQDGRSSITPLRSVYYMAKVTLALLVESIRFESSWGGKR